jgi:hypothetical protein
VMTATEPEKAPDSESASPGSGNARPIAATIRMQRWNSEHRTVSVTSPQPGFSVLRLMDYPAWQVTRNGVQVTPTRRSDGWMAVPVEAGANLLDVRWRTTRDQWAGIWMSLVTLVLILAASWIAARRPGVAKSGSGHRQLS